MPAGFHCGAPILTTFLWSVTNRILGGGAAARLFSNLREEKGYTYGAYSRVSSDLYPGSFVANTEVRNDVTDRITA